MCTSFRLRATDGSVVVGRTMEFPDALGANIVALPKGFVGYATTPSGPGRAWTSSRYPFWNPHPASTPDSWDPSPRAFSQR